MRLLANRGGAVADAVRAAYQASEEGEEIYRAFLALENDDILGQMRRNADEMVEFTSNMPTSQPPPPRENQVHTILLTADEASQFGFRNYRPPRFFGLWKPDGSLDDFLEQQLSLIRHQENEFLVFYNPDGTFRVAFRGKPNKVIVYGIDQSGMIGLHNHPIPLSRNFGSIGFSPADMRSFFTENLSQLHVTGATVNGSSFTLTIARTSQDVIFEYQVYLYSIWEDLVDDMLLRNGLPRSRGKNNWLDTQLRPIFNFDWEEYKIRRTEIEIEAWSILAERIQTPGVNIQIR